MPNAIDNAFRLSLTYPNPSLCQNNNTIEDGRRSDEHPLTKPEETVVAKNTTGRLSQGVLVTCLLSGLLFSSLDTSIAATSLVAISRELQDFGNAPWIVLAYLLTYMGFAIVISKLSDIYGRRNMLVLSIICRGFQGIGASGLYSLTQIGLVEVGPSHRPSLIGAMIGATLTIAFVLGPIIGGVIVQFSDWRWLFNMNIPFGLIAMLAITNFWPPESAASMLSWKAFTKIDFIGSITLLCSSGLLVFAIQQAGSQTYAWNSPEIIIAITISVLCWLLFIAWQILLESKTFSEIEPIFPIRLMQRRVYAAGLLVTVLTGFPYISLAITIPEKLQIVDRQSVLMASVHLLPMLGACATGSFLGGAISSKKNNTAYTIVAAACLQLFGVTLMSIIPSTIRATQYVFQIAFGLGVGLCFSAATIMTNLIAPEQRIRAAAQGAVAQARVLGGCVGISVCTVVFNAHVNGSLRSQLSPEQLAQIHRSPISGLQFPTDKQEYVRSAYSGAFTEETRVMIVNCAVMVAASLFTLERHPPSLEILTSLPKKQQSSNRNGDSTTELDKITRMRQTA
ncbi:major facilitator superfamily transporter [Beauveria bassiana ARSEF 2860]|uniref:Major facilitator superfamily transporter n=1 Tax=Beauveria bassiana (strain ARSEF 2860) TaxID=655819 RepID=J4KKZ4_BEAB2|nr:major facilitator superfamily transporter [Beauveria bassiana ARSEF 2860]EJP61309.1 major facilitator superfamily transporter [Beauveria bassiana ARSEF 2860]